MIEEDSISIYKNILLEQLDLTKEVIIQNFKEILKHIIIEIPKNIKLFQNKIEWNILKVSDFPNLLKNIQIKTMQSFYYLPLYHMINSNIIHGDLHEGNFI